MKLNLKKLAPHLLAILIFFVITLIFFYPVILDGKVMTQNDVVQGISSGQEIKEFRQSTGKEALWTNSMFGGMPAYLISTFWSGDLTRHIHEIISLYLPSPAKYTFLAMLCFYILLLCFKINPYLAIAGGIAYGLNSFFLVSIEAGHIWKVSAIAYMPLVLAGIQLLFDKKYLLGISTTALALALHVRSNHYQITYYLLFILGTFWLLHLIYSLKDKKLPDFSKKTAFILFAGIIGISTSLGRLWTTTEYSPYTIRGKSELTSNKQSTSGGLDRDYAFQWSNGISETFTFLVPYIYGGGSVENLGNNSKLSEVLRKSGVPRSQANSIASQAPTYWGKQPFTSGPIYVGSIVVFLFILGLFTVKGPIKTWAIVITILGFMLSWGKNLESFNYFMFDYFPMYNKFRAVSMALAIPLFTIPFFGFMGLSEFVKNPDKKVLLKTVAITGGICLIILLASTMAGYSSPNDSRYQELIVSALEKQRAAMFKASTFRSIGFIAMTATILFLLVKRKINMALLLAAISLFVFIDLFFVGRKYLDKEKFSKKSKVTSYKSDAADQQISKDETQYRVANLTVSPFQDATTSFSHSSIGGYHGAKLRRYNDVIERYLGTELQQVVSQIQSRNLELDNIPVLNMLNTKYFKLGATADAVLLNGKAQGNAWFVNNVKKANSPDESIELIGIEDLTTVAISEKNSFQKLSIGSINLTSYQPNRLVYETSNNGDGYAVFSEIYYPKGWYAKIDGEDIEIDKVNYILRGLEIPSGNHEIEFYFKPKSYTIGNTVMWITNSIVILTFLLSVTLEIRKHG